MILLSNIFILTYIIMSGLKVPGSLSVTRTALDSVADHKLVQDVLAQEFTTTRKAASDSQAFVYFVECEFDINSKISHEPSGTAGGDDSWGMDEIALDKATFAGAARIKLPSASGIRVPAGLISAKDTDSSLISTFAVTLTLSCSDQGAMTASAAISGADAVSSATAENLLNAQVVRFMKPTASAPAVADADDDVLTATLTAAELASDYATELTALETQYTIADLVASWRINVAAIPKTVDSIMSQHARSLARANAQVFEAGALMVASGAATYGISVDDYEGNAVEVVAEDNVFAVLKQSA